MDAYQEAFDLAIYLRQAIEESRPLIFIGDGGESEGGSWRGVHVGQIKRIYHRLFERGEGLLSGGIGRRK